MIRWLRVVLPELGVLAGVALFYGAVNGVLLYVEWRLRVRLAEDGRQVTRIILGFATVCYAVWRALGYHPLFRPWYRAWLAATPWTSRKPLPLGPIHLVAQDVVLVGSATLVAWLGGDSWALFIPQLFLAIYLAFLAQSLFGTGCWPWGYAVAFGMGAVVWLWRSQPACLIVEGLTYTVAYLGLRQSLARFPWGMDWGRFFGALGVHVRPEQRGTHALGWPFGRLAPRTSEFQIRIPLHHAVLTSLLVGWWLFAIISSVPRAQDRENGLLLVLGAVTLGAALIRVGVYCDGYAPPISLIGRLVTGCWIIPGYDQVFVAPVLTAAAGAVFSIVPSLLELDPLFCHPVALAVVLFLSLGLGPSLSAWRLTGNHRIAEGTQRVDAVRVG
jgi:hypothetical protein